MPATSTHIEYLPAGLEDEDVNYEEAEVELEYEFEPAEAAVMDVNSPLAGPGHDANAGIIEDTIRRADGKPVCDALRAAVMAWWERHGQAGAVEREEEARAEARAWRRSRARWAD
jgi:hypothetical protein